MLTGQLTRWWSKIAGDCQESGLWIKDEKQNWIWKRTLGELAAEETYVSLKEQECEAYGDEEECEQDYHGSAAGAIAPEI